MLERPVASKSYMMCALFYRPDSEFREVLPFGLTNKKTQDSLNFLLVC